ncbi:MFS transporter [Dietzia sp. UCD-THP]|uniref:MFS transporter n=1 Tax=Dietzia sp. UCD-THP TaxID=1292020 RepID=UPI0003805D28|nr:MFS transporter [Dietzia sp. UCD-THP]EYT58657.1 MFS transporter [Dietzia sp. UCD-THP]
MFNPLVVTARGATISSANPPPTPHRGALAVALAVLFGVTGLGSAAVAVALPAISADLDLTAGRAALVVSCYSLALAVGSPVFGRLGDLFGIRLPLLVGMSVMLAAACAGSLVDSLPALVVTRTLQGLGAAAVPALTIAAVQALFTGDSRARAMATYSGVGATINVLGPVVGALLVDPFGWRPVVAIPLLTLLVVPLVWRALPTERQQGATLDPLGAALVGGAAVGAVLSLQAATLGPAVAATGAVLLLVCAPTVVLRSRRRPHGVVPAALVRNPAARRSLLTAASLPAAWFGMLVTVPTVLTAHGWSSAAVGILLLPCAALGLVAPRITGPALIRLGAPRSQLLAAIGTALAIVLAAFGAARVDALALIAATLVLMLAFGLGQPAMTALVADSVSVHHRGGALGLLTLVFLLGGSLGAAAVGGLGEAISLPGALLVLAVLPLTAALAFARPLPSPRPRPRPRPRPQENP